MESKIYVSEKIIIGHIDEDHLDLVGVPAFSDIKVLDISKENPISQRLLGFVTRCEPDEDYAFVVTNQFGVGDSSVLDLPVQLYLGKNQWKDTAALKERMWITFELHRQPRSKRHAAINAHPVSLTIEDLKICRNYSGKYGVIEGKINGSYKKLNCSSVIFDYFYNHIDGRKIILQELYSRGCTDIAEWDKLLSNLTEKELSDFEYDTTSIEVSPTLRLILYKYSKRIETLKDESFIRALNSYSDKRNITIAQVDQCFHSDTDRIEWIDYVSNRDVDIVSDKVRSWLYIIYPSNDILSSVVDRDMFIESISQNVEGVSRLIIRFLQDETNVELRAILTEIGDDCILEALQLINESERTKYLLCIPKEISVSYIYQTPFQKFNVKECLLLSPKGCLVLIEDLYQRKSENVSEWDAVLTAYKNDDKTFVFDDDRLKPTAELRLCLYKHLHSVEWLKHACVIWYVSKLEDKNLNNFIKSLSSADLDLWLRYVSASISNEDLLCRLFYIVYHPCLFASITDKAQVISHYNNSEVKDIKCYLEFAFNNLSNADIKWIHDTLNYDKLLDGLQKLPEDICVQWIDRLPVQDGIKIATSEKFKSTNIFNIFFGELWETRKSQIQYVAFDIESDGDSISEFAFFSEDNLRSYIGEDQLGSLIRRLEKLPIIVGHNIKQWDLPILFDKGLKLSNTTFIWDTLEMEILLDPCRYAYSLHTTHKAEDDVKLTNDLFWNQLFRLSVDSSLVNQLSSVLPSQINDILNSLQVNYFADYFKKTAKTHTQFFQERRPLSDNLIKKLNEIGSLPFEDTTLIVAPENLWPRIAQYVNVCFPVVNDYSKYLCINKARLIESPLDSIVEQKILERFCELSKTPILENLAQYLRVENATNTKIVFSAESLKDYLCECVSHVDCVDINAFENDTIVRREYKHIYIIGAELHDRIHKCSACGDKSFADLVGSGSKLPFVMANTNFAPIKNAKERELLGIAEPELAANFWVERQTNGIFSFYFNYKYQAYRKRFLDHFKVKPVVINWEVKGEDKDRINLTQVSRERSPLEVERVNVSSTQRSVYWLFQMAILGKIHSENPSLPLVYVVNDLNEITELTAYASYLGYFIPNQGTGFRKLEYIGCHPNGMIIISKRQFEDGIGSYRTDKPFCYVWDNMDIDRYMLMWDKLPFKDDPEEAADADRDDKISHTTARQCIHAAWPIFEHYCSLVMANSKDTRFYVLDPHFDDYDELANSCKAQSFKVKLWNDNDAYKSDLAASKKYFKDSRNAEQDIDVEKQKLMILAQWGFNGWRDNQEEIVNHMLEKKGDSIISMPTGGGKSILFQGPAISRAMATKKLSLVITPLRALMQDQVEELWKRGFANNVDYLSGDRLYPEVQNIYRRIRSGELALLFITPERFRVRSFINVLYQRMEMDGGLEYVVFDEAHCISQWGQDFRPDYRYAVLTCIDFRQKYDFMFAMFSATVTTQVESDIRSFLPEIQRLGQAPEDYNPIRQHIGISFKLTEHEDEARIRNIVQYINEKKINFDNSCMIVFCRTHRECEETADALSVICANKDSTEILSKCRDHIGYYHAGLDADHRNDIYEKFKRADGVEPIYVLCATKAFGMGMDIPNVHYVVHYSPPSVLEDYLQEVGRAGRSNKMYESAFPDGSQIPALCLTSKEDFKKLKDLLVKSQMSWSNLTDAKNKILGFIAPFRPIMEMTKKEPVVVPFSVWVKNVEEFNDTTASRLAFHWLEHIGYIKQRYLEQTCLNVTLLDKQSRSRNVVYQYLCRRFHEKETKLVSIKDIKEELKLSLLKIINEMIVNMAEDKKLMSLNNTMHCRVIPRRYCEAKYMVKHDDNSFALHIIMEGLRKLLSKCRKNVPSSFDSNQREEVYKHLLDDVHYDDLITERGTTYMPWYNDEDINAPRGAVTKAETFKKNIITRMGAQMFNVLQYIPGIIYRTNKSEEDVIAEITIKNSDWESYLTKLEEDCLKMIKFACEQTGEFCWAQKIIDFNWTKKGVRYYEDVLAILQHLQYVEHSPLIETGVEVFTTDLSGTPIDDGIDEHSPMYKYRQEFDNQERIKKVRLACMNIFTSLEKEAQGTFIQRYFQSRNYEDYLSLAGEYAPEGSGIMKELTEEALKLEEEKIYGNESKKIPVNQEQIAIYEQPKNVHVNVLAGPGSGKTHMLTMRCAQLIYKEHVEPSHLLVLAYNRAVVVELRNRLNSLFSRLGMSRIANQIHVYTFHALAKKCMGRKLDKLPTELWERAFLGYLKNNINDFCAHFPLVEFVLVDEFQDITKVRLEILLSIHNTFLGAKFFTIGDINQSIYGFDRVPRDQFGRKRQVSPEQYANALNPQPYYDKLYSALNPTQLTMFTNYRSYQGILDKSKEFLPQGADVPKSASSIMEYEPHEQYVYEYTNNQWFNELPNVIAWAQEQNNFAASIDGNDRLRDLRHIGTIAVFFRSNNEVYRGYSKIMDQMPEGTRIRIQGESLSELWREREVYYLISTLMEHKDQAVDLHNDKTANGIREFIRKKMKESPKWDAFMLDVTYTLVLNYVDSIRSDYKSHTWKDMAEYIKEAASRDDGGQVYKIYDNYRNERILKDDKLTIVLTTMHKVKGLEFDIVITTPSFSNLPLVLHRNYIKGQTPLPMADDFADMEEEKRLMFVAYTRAKKRLYIFKGDREKALEANAIFVAPDYEALRYTEPEAGMGKYYLSFAAQFDTINDYISEDIRKGDLVEVMKHVMDGEYYICHSNRFVGRLSNKSTIRERACRDGVATLKDFFISNIFVWTYEDTINSDITNKSDFARRWSPEAIKRGYIYVVQIAGFGIKK